LGWGTGAIGYLPLALLSGLVLYAGLDSAKTWLLNSRRRMTRIEYVLLVSIAVVIVIWGVLLGVTIGIVIAILLFTINYSKLKCIELRQTGKSLRSKVERPSMEEEILRRFDDQLRLFRLRGYLFFGSAETISETVMDEIRHHESTTNLYVMLDFRAVSGIDSSATLAFSRIFDMASAAGSTIMLINMNQQVKSIMSRSVENFDAGSVYPDLDVALEAREVAILSSIEPHEKRPHSATETLRQYLMAEEDVKALEAFFDVQDIERGEILFNAGQPANSMMIVDAGEFEVYRQGHGGEVIRLRKVLAGAILGEMGIYLRGHRTASVRAIVDSRVFVLDDTGLALMHETAPDLALKFNRFVIGVLAARLSHSNNEVLELSSSS
ncbi:MAG TPA: cyclic nucleotide-binding domain-containing protein, partial [Pseudomonadales bacterium]|nr:cyclic nucleotide-binding domain-containing protein [Pseudomonadales bacterium]